MNLRLRFSH